MLCTPTLKSLRLSFSIFRAVLLQQRNVVAVKRRASDFATAWLGTVTALLSLYRLTRDETHLRRAQQFGAFMAEHWDPLYEVPESPASLYLVRVLRSCDLRHAAGSAKANSFARLMFLYRVAAQGLAGAVVFWADLQDPDNARFPGYEL